MIPATISLIALLLAIIIGIVRPKLNIGLISILFGLIIGVYVLGLKDKDVTAMFPSSLFLMLLSITMFFGIASENGTIQKMTDKLLGIVGNRNRLFPLTFFLITFLVSAAGPGNIAATVLVAPVAMQIAYQAKLSPLLMAIMIATGANAGTFSPVAPTGVVSTGLISELGIINGNVPTIVFLYTAIIQSVSALLAYVIFKGYISQGSVTIEKREARFNFKEKITITAMIALVVLVIVFKAPITLVAFVLTFFLYMVGAGDPEKTLKRIPWDAIILVTGVTVLIGITEKGGGLELATDLISSISSTSNINGVLAFVTGLVSVYSSSIGVVLPTFLPLIPSIAEKLGGGNLTEMVIAINVGSHMVDVSPLSTLGAVCIATAQVNAVEKSRIFRRLLIWGLSMAVFGAVIIYLLLDVF